MKLNEFKIGHSFYCGDKQWRCTDKGSRVVVAICLEPVNTNLELGSKDQAWFNGPPYAVVENVFDEYDIENCQPNPCS